MWLGSWLVGFDVRPPRPSSSLGYLTPLRETAPEVEPPQDWSFSSLTCIPPTRFPTPQGSRLGSRGQGHGFLCPPPTDGATLDLADPGGVEPFGPSSAERAFPFRGFHPRLFMSLPFGEHGPSPGDRGTGSARHATCGPRPQGGAVKPLRGSPVEPVACPRKSWSRLFPFASSDAR
jgi:hypothetical protein